MAEGKAHNHYLLNRCRSLNDASHQGYSVLIQCKACGNRRVIDPILLWRLSRVRMWADDFISIGNHIKCGRYRAKYPEVKASSEPPNGQGVIGYRTEADKGSMRWVEPHTYGVKKNGGNGLCAWQAAGGSGEAFRLFLEAEMLSLELGEPFEDAREGYVPGDPQFIRICAEL